MRVHTSKRVHAPSAAREHPHLHAMHSPADVRAALTILALPSEKVPQKISVAYEDLLGRSQSDGELGLVRTCMQVPLSVTMSPGINSSSGSLGMLGPSQPPISDRSQKRHICRDAENADVTQKPKTMY